MIVNYFLSQEEFDNKFGLDRKNTHGSWGRLPLASPFSRLMESFKRTEGAGEAEDVKIDDVIGEAVRTQRELSTHGRMSRFLPILSAIRQYNWRDYLVNGALSGQALGMQSAADGRVRLSYRLT